MRLYALGYNDFDIFYESEESWPFDGYKIEFTKDTFTKAVFCFFGRFVRIWLQRLQKVLIRPRKMFVTIIPYGYQKTEKGKKLLKKSYGA